MTKPEFVHHYLNLVVLSSYPDKFVASLHANKQWGKSAMSLQSLWFRGNTRLEQCLISDPSHVQIGNNGDHVTLIQGALLTLDKSEISRDEQEQQSYRQSTANAVLEYKKKRS